MKAPRWLWALAIAAIAYLVAVLRTAWVLVHPKRDYAPDGHLPPEMPAERISFPGRDGLKLAGWFCAADGAPGTVIFCHGVWTNHREMDSRAEALWRRGYNVMTFDFQGSGESEGRFTTLGAREVGDLLGTVDYVERRCGGPIGVMGNSMGGSVALLASAADRRIAAVATDGAFATASGTVALAFRAVTGLPALPFKDAVTAAAEVISRSRLASVRPLDSIGAISPRPLLLIHGAEDRLVRLADAYSLFAAAGEPKELWIVPNAGHVESFHLAAEEFTDRLDRLFRGAFAPA